MTANFLLSFIRFWKSRISGFNIKAVKKATIKGIEIGNINIQNKMSNIAKKSNVQWRFEIFRNKKMKSPFKKRAYTQKYMYL